MLGESSLLLAIVPLTKPVSYGEHALFPLPGLRFALRSLVCLCDPSAFVRSLGQFVRRAQARRWTPRALDALGHILLYSGKPVKPRKNVAAACETRLTAKGDQRSRRVPGLSRAVPNNAPAVNSGNTNALLFTFFFQERRTVYVDPPLFRHPSVSPRANNLLSLFSVVVCCFISERLPGVLLALTKGLPQK